MSRYKQQDNLIGQSNNFVEVLEQVSQVALLNKPVLIIGERGTGKELIAARLHFLSKRWDQSYVKLNCAALNENLLDSELFGYESGAFTGANKRHEGRFERASHGTLFLDEIANTTALIQEKLLRVVEYGEFERVGGAKTIKTDVRLIAATNEDLPMLTEKGDFRADLLDRLAFDVITLPPLRARIDDILLLAEHFAINMTRELELELFSGFTEKAKRSMLDYHWPGNIRELKNVVERSVYRNNNANLPVNNLIIDPFESPYRPKSAINKKSTSTLDQFIAPTETTSTTAMLASHQTHQPCAKKNTIDSFFMNESQVKFPLSLKKTSQTYEVKLIKSALAKNQFNQKKTAQALELTYHQLRAYLKKYSLLDDNQSHE